MGTETVAATQSKVSGALIGRCFRLEKVTHVEAIIVGRAANSELVIFISGERHGGFSKLDSLLGRLKRG